ncbi:unnamed protein product [Pleuronectes platessa]|uniref:Uncharacterized protein n=1 Tax=Pleuronectes platessa TaxID=8262 RepID=A0A9N7VIG0_PLEPL|nr:unnamed protein product [Pleuronectes platessa]
MNRWLKSCQHDSLTPLLCPGVHGSVVAWGWLIPVAQRAHFSALVQGTAKVFTMGEETRPTAFQRRFWLWCVPGLEDDGNRLCRLYQEPPLATGIFTWYLLRRNNRTSCSAPPPRCLPVYKSKSPTALYDQ